MNLITELRRRNVFRIGIAYAIASWLLIQIADVMIDNIGAPDWVFRTLLLVLAIGFPISLIIAWAFELTPEGIKRESDVTRDDSITRKTGRKLDRAIIIVLALAVGYLLIDKLVLSERDTDNSPSLASETGDTPSVAVLPFENMSRNPDNEYFSDGLTDTLLHMLAQLPDLKVAARTSSFSFKNQSLPIPEIAAALGVQHVLEGSVQQAGDQIRVTAQLVRAEDGFHVWSQNYTRPMQDIFAIQDEIAADVARALDVSLLAGTSAVAGVATSDLNAYDSYLRALDRQAIGSFAALDEAESLYERALTLDPGFTDARLGLVRNYMVKHLTGMIPLEDLRQSAVPLLQRELETDPNSRLVQAYQCVLDGRFGGAVNTRENAEQGIRECEALLSKVPTETFIRSSVAAGLHFALNDSEAALELIDAGLLIDPLSDELYLQKGQTFLDLDRFDEAEAALLRAAELNPAWPRAYSFLSYLERARGDLIAALRWERKVIELDPEDHELPFSMAELLLDLELAEEAGPWIERVNAMVPGSDMARALHLRQTELMGDNALAIELARQMIVDDVTVRGGVMYSALFSFTHLMMIEDRSREAYDDLVALHPGLDNFDVLPETWPLRVAQRWLIALMSDFATPEARLQAWNDLIASYEDTGFDFFDSEMMQVWDPLIRGQIDDAVTAQIELRLNDPLAEALVRHKGGFPVHYAPIYADPRHEAARAERERQFLALRAEVQALMLEPEWNE